MTGSNPDSYIDADGTMLTYCWCEATQIRVAAELIRKGRTKSCGRHRCRSTIAVAS